MKAKLAYFATSSAIILAAAPTAAIAQNEEGAAPDSRVETITVTAQKREQNIIDVPVSVDVLSGDELRDQQISSMQDIALLSPSVTYAQSTGPLNSSLYIRGIGTNVFSAAVEPSVSFVIDGVVMARQGQAFTDLIDISRVEVLRGPQSTLFGKNASAGVVSVTTKAPSETFELDAQALVAERDEYQLDATISGPISDTVRARVTAFYKDIGGHIENIYDGSDLNGRKSYGVRGKILFEPTDAFALELSADWRESDDACCQWQLRRADHPAFAAALLPLVAGPENDKVNVDGDVFNKTEAWGGAANARYDLGGAELTSVTAYRSWTFDNSLDIDGTPSQGGVPYFFGGLLGLDVNDNGQDLKQFSQELRIASDGSTRLNYVFGAFFSTLDYAGTFRRRLCFINVGSDKCPPSIAINPFFSVPGARSYGYFTDVDNSNVALFGQVDYAVTERLTLTGGLRVLRDSTSFSYDRPYAPLVPGDMVEAFPAPAGQTDGPNNPLRTGEGEVSDVAVTGKAAVQYALGDDVNVYASYTRGYKGPTVDLPSSGLLSEIDPETSNSFEGGVKGFAANGRLSFSLSGFYVKYKDYQGQIFDPFEGVFRLNNAGALSTRGVEAELTARPLDGLLLSAGAAYTDAHIDAFGAGQCYTPTTSDPDCDPVTKSKDYAGFDLNNSPDWSFVLNGRYDFAAPAGLPANMFVTASYQWQDDTQFSLNQDPNTIQEAYGIANASIGVSDKDHRVTATFFVKNLFDQHFAGLMFADILGSGSDANGVNIDQYITKNAKRYFGATLRLSF